LNFNKIGVGNCYFHQFNAPETLIFTFLKTEKDISLPGSRYFRGRKSIFPQMETVITIAICATHYISRCLKWFWTAIIVL